MARNEEIMPRLVRQYLELCTACYRAKSAMHGERGRFRRGHRGAGANSAALKKIDLDEALVRVYRRFFGAYVAEAGGATSTSTSKRRRQGSETCSAEPSAASGTPSTSG